MKYVNFVVGKRDWVCLFFLLFSLSPAVAQSDPVLLTVNGVPVQRSEFVYSYHRNSGVGDAARISASDYLQQFVDYKLKLAAALDAGYELPAQPVGASVPQSYTAIPDKREAEAYYQRICATAGQQDMLRLSQIFLRVGTRASSAAADKVKQRIDSVYQALSAGTDFQTLAARLSDDVSAASGGDLGWIGPCQLLEEVERQAYALGKGEMSRPFQSPAGWHIVKVLDRQPATSETVHQWFLAPRQVISDKGQVTSDNVNTQEYNEGVLVWRITRAAVWDKGAPDENTLMRFFKKNKKRYGKKLKKRDFPAVRELVLADYMQHCEEEWVADLRRQYKVKVNKTVLRTIE